MYKITAIINKPGGSPVQWTRFSVVRLTKRECEKRMSGKTEAGKSLEEKVTLENFECVRV
ncbi:DUF1187 family protein [Salmonella enterica]|nr:DUF1187 family protein [Salmonella enterica]EEM7113019.1 DUF1187 family protein [Salmonella enterica subsp. enterica serovar Poona]HBI5523284.1 DUF1187 family protein [Salmonella enterica subsp. enterica serovar Welikade]EAS9889812.1 DUF1187 family protein [Salmonella enterica]EEG2844246.1 DUF1187 family protein [Salmonella enterica]